MKIRGSGGTRARRFIVVAVEAARRDPEPPRGASRSSSPRGPLQDHSPPPHNAPQATIGADFSSKALTVDDRPVMLQLWDTAGQERFMSLGPAFYRGADAAILVFDVNSTKSFEDVETWRNDFLTHTRGQQRAGDPNRFPFVILGNKIDLDGGASRQVDARAAEQWCAARGGLPYFEVSAKEDTRVEEAFLEATRLAIQNKPAETAAAAPVPSLIDMNAGPGAAGGRQGRPAASQCCS